MRDKSPSAEQMRQWEEERRQGEENRKKILEQYKAAGCGHLPNLVVHPQIEGRYGSCDHGSNKRAVALAFAVFDNVFDVFGLPSPWINEIVVMYKDSWPYAESVELLLSAEINLKIFADRTKQIIYSPRIAVGHTLEHAVFLSDTEPDYGVIATAIRTKTEDAVRKWFRSQQEALLSEVNEFRQKEAAVLGKNVGRCGRGNSPLKSKE